MKKERFSDMLGSCLGLEVPTSGSIDTVCTGDVGEPSQTGVAILCFEVGARRTFAAVVPVSYSYH